MVAKTAQKVIVTIDKSLDEQSQLPTAPSNGGSCWQKVVDGSAMGIAVADLTGRFLAANAALQKMLGYTEEELRALPGLAVTLENDREANRTLVRELLEGGRQQFEIEKTHRRKDGSLIWIRNHVCLVPSAENVPGFLMTIVDDITERRQAEEQLQAKKAHLEELFEQSPGAVALLDGDHRVVHINQEFTRLFGYLQEEVVGRELIDLTIPTELPDEVQRYHHLINSRQRVEEEGIRRRKDGTLLHVSILGVGVSGGCGRVATYAIYQDITERKRLEEKIRENERELRLQTEVIPQHIWSALPNGSVDYCNQGLLAYLGLTLEEMRLAGTSFVHPEDQDRLLGAWQHATSLGTAYEVEARLRGNDGEYRWFLERALPLRDDRGQIIKWYGTNTDIEERKRAENELQRSQAYLVEGERLSHTGSWAWNVSTGQSYWSEETFRIFGFDPAKTKPSFEMFLERVHPEDRPRLEQECNGMRTETKDSELDFRIVLPDGLVKYIHAVGHALVNESGEITERFGVHVDMTEQYQARAELERAYQEINRLKDQLYKENLALREEIDQASMFEEIVGSSPALQRVLSNVAKVAPTDSTVLITGETGTGKELIARAIHKRSHRSDRAFVKVNCAALPPSLIGSELFGHEKGAFTGALQRRLGRFELAEGGTIFLDEIGDLPAETQIALLRVLQEREFERIGGGEPITADVRVIAATHRDLKAAAAAGTFRADLFYRLNVFPIEVPPLRERLEDIPLLVEYFIGRYASQAGKNVKNIYKPTLELFQSYDWPGNLRELQNVIERSVILCEGETLSVDPSWMSAEPDPAPQATRPLAERLMEHEKQIIESALTASRGRVAGPSGAAVKVGMPPSTLEARIKALKIDKKRFNSG